MSYSQIKNTEGSQSAPDMDPTSEHNAGTSNAGDNYVWQPEGHPVSIRLNYTAVDKMTLEVMRGFGSIPRRGAEVGGLLLGTAEVNGNQRIVNVVDFHPVACEHSRGPSYLLSDKDYEGLDAALEQWRPSADREGMYVVGFYRSHTRDGLGMSQEDINILDAYLPEGTHHSEAKVMLLIKPYATRVSVGGFFFRDNGTFERTESSYLEFPFRRKELGGGSSGTERLATAARFGEARVSEPPIQFPHVPKVSERENAKTQDRQEQDQPRFAMSAPSFGYDGTQVKKESKFKSGWVWIPLSAIFLFMGVLLGFQTAITMRPRGPASVGAEVFNLSLTAVKSADSLNITWDRTAPAIRTAGHGVLYIKDGDFNKSLNLDASELQVGSVVYRKPSTSVSFKLEVYPKDRTTVSETVEYREAK